MSVIESLITDRTASDVEALYNLISQGANPPESHRGAYNASDLNRVGEAVDYLKLRLYDAGIIANDKDFDISYTLPQETITLACEQDGTGTPAPDNVRQIYPAISLPRIGDVYSGTLDVLTGLLTVDRVVDLFDGSETWGTESTSEGVAFYCNLSQNNKMAGRTSGAINTELKMNWLATRVSDAMIIPNAFVGSTGNYINVRRTGFANVAEMKTNLSQNPLQVIYPIAVPTAYQLTPQEMNDVAKQIGQTTVMLKPEAMAKTDWTNADIPTQSQMQDYLDNIWAIWVTIMSYRPGMELPEEMRYLNYIGANQIEDLLKQTDLAVSRIKLSFRAYSGRQLSGVNALP